MAPWSGSAPSQAFTRTDGVRTGDDVFVQQEAASVDIEATLMDVHATDMGDGINACLKKDGGNTATADIPMGGFSLTNVGQAAARTESAQFADVQDNRGQYVATVGGTADVITLTPTVAITAYAAGQRFSFIASGDNTTSVTVNVSAVAAKAIVLNDGSNTALAGGEIQSGAMVDIEYDGTQFLLLSVIGALLGSGNLSGVASAATAATNLGLGTGDSPQFTAVNIGHASDTTITRTGAGDIAVEGNAVYRAGGTDVPVTDGGTGASTAANARTALGVAYAAQADMETPAATVVVIPSVQHFHPAHPKAGGVFVGSGVPAFASGDVGMGAITDGGTGIYTLALDTAFATVNYWINGWARSTTTRASIVWAGPADTVTKSSLQVRTDIADNSAAPINSPEVGITFWGDYA